MLNYAINIKVKGLCGSDNYLLLKKKQISWTLISVSASD